MAYRVNTGYDAICNLWVTEIVDETGRLYSVFSDETEEQSISNTILDFAEQILYPSKDQRQFDWAEWPAEHEVYLLNILTSSLTVTKSRANRLTKILSAHPNLRT